MIKAIQRWGAKHDKLTYLLTLALIGLIIGLLVFNSQQSFGGIVDANTLVGKSYSNEDYSQLLQFYNNEEGSLTLVGNRTVSKSFIYSFEYGRIDVTFNRSDETPIVLFTLKNGVYNKTNNVFYFID